MSIRTLIEAGLWYLTNWGLNMAKKQRYPSVGKTKAKLGASGKDVCGACDGEIVQVNNRGTRACWKCGKKAT